MSSWDGNLSNVMAAHLYVLGQNSAGTKLSSIVAGSADTSQLACGLCKALAAKLDVPITERTAENAKMPIKFIVESQKIDIEASALIPTDLNKSLAHGKIFEWSTLVGSEAVSAVPENITGEAWLYFLDEDDTWAGAATPYVYGIHFLNVTFIKGGEGLETIDGKAENLCKFTIKCSQDSSGNVYEYIAAGTIDTTVEFI